MQGRRVRASEALLIFVRRAGPIAAVSIFQTMAFTIGSQGLGALRQRDECSTVGLELRIAEPADRARQIREPLAGNTAWLC